MTHGDDFDNRLLLENAINHPLVIYANSPQIIGSLKLATASWVWLDA